MNNPMPLVLPFSAIRARDLPLVGGKGANLGEMTAAGLPIPPGFCLTTAAFRRFVAASSDAERIYALLEAATDVESVRQVGAQVRAILHETPIPPEIADAALAAWRAIGPEQAYAVRSSATAEDLPGASFAGQQDTYLNVIGEEALLDAVRRCWASLFTDRAILYRVQNGFAHREVALSVVVQQMVMAEKSGILFTADPLTGHRHTLTIDASFGLGEALVGGLVTPDTYHVDKRSRQIIKRQVAEKQVAIYPLKEGGTRQVEIPPEQRNQPALSDAQILALTDLGARIEAHYGQPQDIEWAIAPATGGEGVYILQARPITSLYPIEGLASRDGTLHIYFSMGHQQNMTRAMPALSLTAFEHLLPLNIDKDHPYYPLHYSGGRIFIDITPILRHPVGKRLVSALLSQFDVLAPRMFAILTRRPEFRGPQVLHFSFSFLKGLFSILRRVFSALWLRDLDGFVDRTNALMDDYIQEARRRFRAQPAGKAQIQAILDFLPTVFSLFLNWVPEAVAGIAATRLLPKVAGRALPPEQLEALTLGIPGNVVNEMNLMLGDLADLARGNPDLVAWFDHLGDEADPWLTGAAEIPGGAPFLEAWEAFLEKYGARGFSEIDFSTPRWCEDPLPVLRVIAGHLHKTESSRAHFEAQVRAREAAFAALTAKVRGPRAWLSRRLYTTMVQVGGMREHHKFLAVRLLWEVKQILQENAALLVEEGRLSHPDDIWFLAWDELSTFWDSPERDWAPVIAQRRADLERFQKLNPPVIITSDGETPVVQYDIQDIPPGALVGNPVSAGVVEGIAHVVRDPQRETLQPGEILVAAFTDPGWTPLFINAGGLVMEIGGALAHGSVVAREYGIPAVVGVREATQKIRTGQRLRVDGNRGVVEIL